MLPLPRPMSQACITTLPTNMQLQSSRCPLRAVRPLSLRLSLLFRSKQGFYTSHLVLKLSPLVSHYAISQKNLHECDTAAEILRINSFGQPCDECGTWERSRHDIYEKDEIGAASATAAPHVQKLCFVESMLPTSLSDATGKVTVSDRAQ